MWNSHLKVEEDMWLYTSSDSDGFFYNDDLEYAMDLDDIYVYGNGDEHSSEEDEDTSSEEDDDGDNSAKDDDDGDNSAEDVSDG